MRNRKKDFKIIILKLLKDIKFNILNLNTSRWLTIIWSFVWIISLFMNWIIIQDNWIIKNYSSFNSISWNTWYIIILLLLTIIFLTFWGNYKEKMKLYSNIDLKNYVIILFSWIFMVLTWIICVSFSVWLETFSKDIKYWNWVILSIVSAILIIAWGYLTRKEFYKNSSEIILEKLEQNRRKEREKNNMSLPF